MTAEKRVTAFRQEQIVSAATALIAQSGLKGLNMAALARQIGLVPSALYRHYKGKMQIVGIILDRVRENLRANIRAARESSSEPCGRLRQILARHLVLLKQNPGMTRLVFSDELESRFPSERAKLYGILMDYLDAIEAIIREGQKSGCLRSDLPPRACARLFVGMLQSAVLMGHLSGGGDGRGYGRGRGMDGFREGPEAGINPLPAEGRHPALTAAAFPEAFEIGVAEAVGSGRRGAFPCPLKALEPPPRGREIRGRGPRAFPLIHS